MSRRFFVQSPITSGEASLVGDEARHLTKSLRGQPGGQVTLFDGGGAEFAARIRRIGRNSVDLDILAREEVDRELPFPLELGVALPKGDRQRWLVEKSVELGVSRLTPLRTARGVAEPLPRSLQRLRRAVIEASKQCGRNRLMEVLEPLAVDDYLAAPLGPAIRWFAHPHSSPRPATGGPSLTNPDWRPVYLAVGPEGGFTAEEVRRAESANWRMINLGPRILRTETAAAALIAVAALGGRETGAAN
jgi:16S rRNA (uracil1498-N3)-methyltransferase